ncbi:hypothetical protein [Flammeovirga sp. SJP92]|uniref:hypothetical protein n=1 Tax=Flammeovirga sp. SJP92 TaxID=1775430 RepID=UPI00078883BE|nr:hypothetical protein [Flammeovirga sp. SJP92]KXX70785.1 hypothetical protein AVL50_07195 [Flammeovirga sp. SJP92]
MAIAEKDEKKKRIAERLYIEEGEQVDEIAKVVGSSSRTISRWANQGEWKKQRDILLASPHKIKAYMDRIILQVMEGKDAEGNPIDAKMMSLKADSISKMVTSRSKVGDKITANTAFSVLKDFNFFLSQMNPDLAKKITEYQYLYIQQKGEGEIT